MPREIKVHRAGCALWLDIDGYETPVDWIDAAAVAIGAADGPDSVTVTLYADHVTVDAQDIAADVRQVEVPDGEAEEGSAQEAAEQLIRVPVDQEVPDPRSQSCESGAVTGGQLQDQRLVRPRGGGGQPSLSRYGQRETQEVDIGPA